MEFHNLRCYRGDIILGEHFFKILSIIDFDENALSQFMMEHYLQKETTCCLFPLRTCVLLMEKE